MPGTRGRRGQIAAAAVAVFAAGAALAQVPDAELARSLAAAMGVNSATGARVSDEGRAIRAFIGAGYVARRPDRRMDYTDYRLMRRPFAFLGQALVAVEEEYLDRYVGCCVNPGVGAILKVSGDRSELEAFATANRCRLLLDPRDVADTLRQLGIRPAAGTFVRLSCRERDALAD